MLLPDDDQFGVLEEKLRAAGAQVRRVRYLLEDEAITTFPGAEHGPGLLASSSVCRLSLPSRRSWTEATGSAAAAARDAFDTLWQDHLADSQLTSRHEPIEAVVPADLRRFFPFVTVNPAQGQALPHVFGHDDNLLVVAPTGAGKTVIGMAAALRTVVQEGRKSAWLVPQRSLTDELDRELAGWRSQGLRVERLSGEHSVDIERIHRADLWVATTEKFEAICRASAFREALAEVGSLVVDEVHMLGDPARGPVLEALLARMRDGQSRTRIVGLSATIANAGQIAGWLRARLLQSSWRPSNLTWQLPAVPFHSDFTVTEAARTRLAAAITALVAQDGGSVLVFCGSKRNVRRTALVIAAGRGADVSGVRPDNSERLHQVCREARVALHYQGWDHRQESERAFRQREADVLVATSTVAAGVNLPARAVIIQDTQAGLNDLDVATVQQMFGRAGRIGAGEREGWAFLIVDEHERAGWQSRLVAGHTVHSRIEDSLPEQVLSEAVQRRVSSAQQAEQWWVQTLAFHQGQRGLRPLRRAIQFLVSAGMLTQSSEGPTARQLGTTELGRLTARLMVSPILCDGLRTALARAPVPAGPDEAEQLIIEVLVTVLPKLARANAGDAAKAAVTSLLAARRRGGRPVRHAAPAESAAASRRGDLARAALLAVAISPEAFRPGVRHIGGVPYSAMYPVLEEAPRYLHWLACQGLFGTLHPWSAIVAGDLERRITWRMLQPGRGAGRLLWACEQMATSAHARQVVPELWAAARARGHASPDWPVAGRPRQCRLDRAGYLELLRERATASTVEGDAEQVRGTGPAGSVLAVWAGNEYVVVPIARGREVTVSRPPGGGAPGAAVFTWRGDYRATGWLAAYSQAAS
ncbi:MAG TPA: DEAD/DEAH box helicase [Streptosporangiaceae bacterium]|nr:DEAD/DEAH box helicase [Streptosporangiaceae bacterium]